MIVLWIIISLVVVMFLAGFMEPAKADQSKALSAMLYLIGVVLFVPNRAGAAARRSLRALKRV